MSRKIMIIGIDSLEQTYIDKLIEDGVSKGFINFRESGIIRPLKSTFPPDTLLAWPTIYTGLLPHKFGLKPEPEDIHVLKEESIKIRNKLRGRTFWDIASQKERRVLIINPIFGYPPWRVRGVMISGPCFGLKGITLSQPPLENVMEYRLGTYGRVPLLPHEYKLVWNEALEQLADVFKLAYKMINSDSYDLVFFADYTLDRIQHYYWHFENDESRFILISELKDAITKYYKVLDFMIYWFIKKFEKEYTFVVLGDHGHKERPNILVALEDILNQGSRSFSIKETVKHLSYTYLHCTRLSNLSYYLVKKLQEKGIVGRLLKKRNTPIKSCKLTIETLGEFGLKEYVGIKIKGIDSEDLKNDVLVKLSAILIRSGLAEFVAKPSHYYETEEQIDDNADLYVKLVDGLGNMQSRGSFKYIPNYTRRIIRGGHSIYSSLMIYDTNQSYKILTPYVRVQDITPSILGIMGISADKVSFDGVRVIRHV